MKTTGIRKAIFAALFMLVIVFVMSCATRHSPCMKYYYRDVRMGLAH